MSLAPDELMVRNGGPVPGDARGAAAAALLAQLTPRQRLVGLWLTAGFSDEEIAHHLGLATEDVRADFDTLALVLRNAFGSRHARPAVMGAPWRAIRDSGVAK